MSQWLSLPLSFRWQIPFTTESLFVPILYSKVIDYWALKLINGRQKPTTTTTEYDTKSTIAFSVDSHTSPLPAKAFCVDLTTEASAPGNLKQNCLIPAASWKNGPALSCGRGPTRGTYCHFPARKNAKSRTERNVIFQQAKKRDITYY